MSLLASLDRRVQRRTVRNRIRPIATQLVAAERRYRGGTPAEQSSHAALRASLQHQLRATYFAGCGRRIHLDQLMAQTNGEDYDRVPVWALVDPRQPIGEGNCSRSPTGRTGDIVATYPNGGGCLSGVEVGGKHVFMFSAPDNAAARQQNRYHRVSVVGMPALPPPVREIIRDPRIKRASMVGVLYQPSEWQRVNPDPALVVEWADLPGEYYALAVWGVDGPRIMEFID